MPQPAVADMPLQRQTFAFTIPSGCGKLVCPTGWLSFQAHGWLSASSMKSCQRNSGPSALKRPPENWFDIGSWLLFPIHTPVVRLPGT